MQQDKSHLKNIVEGILFVSGQGVEIKDIAEKLEVSEKEVKEVIEQLKEEHKDDGINVITYKSSAQMCSNPIYADDIATVLNPIREKQLTKAALETLAIIAYKQPVTRLDIEQVRGVNCDYAMQILMNFNLVEVVGRKDVIGKPLLFGTTDEFLKRFDLNSIDDLPDYEELLSRIKVLHESVTNSLYKSTEIIPEEELPDSKARLEKEKAEDDNNSSLDNNIISDEESKSSSNDTFMDNLKEKDFSKTENDDFSNMNGQLFENLEQSVGDETLKNGENYETEFTEIKVRETLSNEFENEDFFNEKDDDLL